MSLDQGEAGDDDREIVVSASPPLRFLRFLRWWLLDFIEQLRDTFTILHDAKLLLTPGAVLRLEGVGMIAAALAGYGAISGNWLAFILGFMLPDLPMVAYLVGVRPGTALYNLTHNLTLPGALAGYGFAEGAHWPLAVVAVWVAHIAADRFLGYGCKYPSGVLRDTHLQRV